jgi:hypothetical protein
MYKTLRIHEIREMLRKKKLKESDFGNFMYGQTVQYDPDLNETLYYTHDVERFIRMKTS